MTRRSIKLAGARTVFDPALSVLSAGYRPGRRRQNVTRTRGLLILCGVLLTVVATAPATVAQGAPAAPTIDLVQVDPWVRLGDQLHIDIRTDGSADPTPTQVRVNVHVPLDSSAELTNSLTADEGPVLYTATLEIDSLPKPAPGVRSIVLDISGTVNEGTTLRMAEPGVYPVVVTPIDADGNEGASLRTPVIRLDHDQDPERVALRAPDVGIVVDASTTPAAEESGRRPLTDGEGARFGRLANLVETARGQAAGAAAEPFPLTVTTTSDTLTAISESEQEGPAALHQALLTAVQGSDDNSAPRRDPPSPVDVIPLTAVAVDFPDLIDAGLEDVARDLAANGRASVEAVVGEVAAERWIVSGRFDEPSAELIKDMGYDHVLIGADELEHVNDAEAPAAPQIVAAGAAVDGLPASLDATIIDTETSEWLSGPLDVSGPRSDVAAIAMSGLILRSPNAGTDLVVSVGDVPADSVLAAALPLLTATDSPINLRPVSELGDDIRGSGTDGEASFALAESAGTDELRSIAPEAREVMEKISILTAMVDDRAPQTRARDLLAAAVSSDTPQSRRDALVDAATAASSGILDRVNFTGTSNLNITSRRSTLPILFDNRNDFPVTVALRARSDRLSFPEGDTMTVDLPPGITRIDFPVEALASGSVPLSVELRDASGSVILAEQQFHVRSTAISGVGLLVSFGALLVLIAWWIRTWSSNRHRAPAVD